LSTLNNYIDFLNELDAILDEEDMLDEDWRESREKHYKSEVLGRQMKAQEKILAKAASKGSLLRKFWKYVGKIPK